MSKTVLYCRAANSGRFENEAQLDIVRRFAEEMGCHQPVAYCDWNTSGITLERPCLQKLLSDIRAGEVGRVAVHSISRLSRDTIQLHELFSVLRQHDVELISVKDGGMVDLTWPTTLVDSVLALAAGAKTRSTRS